MSMMKKSFVYGRLQPMVEARDWPEFSRPKLTPEGKAWFEKEMFVFGHLTHALGHEINNPLIAIMGNCSLLEEEIGPKKELTSIDNGATRIADVVKRLIFASRVCSWEDYSFGEMTPAELGDLLETSLEEVAVSVNFPETGGRVLIANSMLIIALKELLKNSQEAGASEIKVEISQREKMMAIDIVDNGSGIGEKEDLFRLNASTKEDSMAARVLSLGLFVVKTVALGHGGGIEVRDRKATGKKGTVVRMTFPLKS